MASQNKKPGQLSIWSARLLGASSRLAAFCATRLARGLIILVCVLLVLYLSYQRVWVPIIGTAPLPPGVPERSAELNDKLLEAINRQRLQRVEAPRRTYDVGTIFRSVTSL